MAEDPRWGRLPAELGDLLASDLRALSDEIVAVVRREVPLYARPLEGSFGRGIRLGVHEALRQFCLLVQTGGRGETGGLAVYTELGRGEWRHGRPLESLLAAYRVGARVAWRRFALLAADSGLGTEELVALAELVFAHIDELSAASAEGFAAEQSAAVGERDRQRQALLRLLLAPVVDRESVLAAAKLAAWPAPQSLSVILAPAGAQLGARLGPDALIDDVDPVLAIVGDPGAASRWLRLLAGTGAVIGPVRELTGAAASRHRAEALLELRRAGRVRTPPRDPLHTEDYLAALVLWADPEAAIDLADAALAPLASLPAATRERLEQTLRAWLRHAGERAAAARSLHVHPQTVRYRMGQLRELLGNVLDDPEARLALMLALETRV
ncbi:MAG TPA: helix-turn-helix domain-containing protein [Mycobacteriales bacterium]|jgi:hypothetical protein|nr:helix-turn-helix domain-containing protein [Mycobacteriales bacterium]